MMMTTATIVTVDDDLGIRTMVSIDYKRLQIVPINRDNDDREVADVVQKLYEMWLAYTCIPQVPMSREDVHVMHGCWLHACKGSRMPMMTLCQPLEHFLNKNSRLKNMDDAIQKYQVSISATNSIGHKPLTLKNCLENSDKEPAPLNGTGSFDTADAAMEWMKDDLYQVDIKNEEAFYTTGVTLPVPMGIYVPSRALSKDFNTTLPATITQTFAKHASSLEDDVTESFIGPTITFMPHGCKFARPILVFLKIPVELLDTSGRYEYVVLYSDTTDEDPYACEWDELSSYEEGHVSGVVLPEHGLAVLSLNHFCKFGILKRLKEKMMEVQVYSNYDRVDNEIKLTCLLCPENYSESKEYQEARRKIGGTLVQHAMTVIYSDKYSIDLSVSSICQSWVDEDGDDNTQSIPHMLVWDGHFPSREFTFIPSLSSSLSRLTCKLTVVQSSYEAATLKIKVRPEECQMGDSPSDRRDSMSRSCPLEDSGIFGEVDDSSTSPERSANKEVVILPTTHSVTPLHSTTSAPSEIRLLCTVAASRNSSGSDNGEISQLSVSLGPLLAPYNGMELNTIGGNVTNWIGENAPLRDVYHSVVNEMNPEPVLDILYQDKFIQSEQLEQLRGLVTSYDKNRRILGIILRMDPKTFAGILERCGQKDLANQVRDICTQNFDSRS